MVPLYNHQSISQTLALRCRPGQSVPACKEPPGLEKPPLDPAGGSGHVAIDTNINSGFTYEPMMDYAAANLEAGFLNCGGSARSADL